MNPRNTFEELVKLHELAFAAHLSLWGAMIDAACGGPAFTAENLTEHERAIEQAESDAAEAACNADPDIASRALALHDRRLMDEHGLLFDDDMFADVDMLVGNVLCARPTLIVGDKGIAKTQLAKFVMSLYGSDPIVISVKGDMMSDELIGQVKHDKEQQTFRFYEGAVPRAMRAGAPILLDEINFGDQAIIARLQDILLKRPGQTAFIQEEAAEIQVQPGFVVIATANEASSRYKHREVLDPAIRDRFEIISRSYPDLDRNPIMDSAPSLRRLALASQISPQGSMSPHIDADMLDALVRIAAITEHLYAVPAKEAAISFDEGTVKSVVHESAEPVLTDCITPRALCRTVEDSSSGNLPGRALDERLMNKLVRSLDQAGSNLNAKLVAQAAMLAGIDFVKAG